jgi:hypothetical protein
MTQINVEKIDAGQNWDHKKSTSVQFLGGAVKREFSADGLLD